MKTFLTLTLLLLTVACGTPAVIPPATSAPKPSVPSTKPSTSVPAMPDVVGMRLVEAEERLAGKGYPVEVEDATGRSRPVLERLNWVVDAQLPVPGTAAPRGTKVLLKVSKPTDTTASPSAVAGVVPEVVCLDLQAAQDALRAAGFYNLTSEDATGQGRQQLVDRNWVVVDQSVRPGAATAALERISLQVVKFGEPTGTPGCRS